MVRICRFRFWFGYAGLAATTRFWFFGGGFDQALVMVACLNSKHYLIVCAKLDLVYGFKDSNDLDLYV